MFASNAAQAADQPKARSGSGCGAAGAQPRGRRAGALSGAAVLLAVLVLALPAGALAQVSFRAASDYPVPDGLGFPVFTGPTSVAVGDINGDKDRDLAVVNRTSDVAVLLGGKFGSFGSATMFGVGDSPSSVAMGDFDADSHPDLAVANTGSDTISVLLGRGTGSFDAATTVVTGDKPRSVAVGQFNRDEDSYLDLAVANGGSNAVSVLLGKGDGTFGSATNYEMGANSAPNSVAVRDFDLDSDPDLAVANEGSNTVSVLLGGDGGSFGSATSYELGADSGPSSVAVGDFDRGGIPDLVVANSGSNTVSVLEGSGTGTFRAATSFAAGDTPASVAVGFLDGDADLDLAVADLGSRSVSVLLGGDRASFGAPTTFGVGYFPTSVAVGDFDDDLDPDLAVANAASEHVSVLMNNDPPDAVDDTYAVDEDMQLGTLSSGADGVLRNDTDPEGDARTAELVEGPQHGSLTFNENGSFLYVPSRDFNGTDSFSYKASDGMASDTATVTITVRARNDRPRASEDTYAIDEDTALNVAGPGVLANDSDVDGDSLKAVPDPDISCCPRYGSVTLNPDGSFVYTPNEDFTGTDTFYYRADDGSPNSDAAMVTIRVNAVDDAPVANDDAYQTDEDTPLTIAAGVLANDTDADRDSLTAALASNPANGRLKFNDDGSYSYTPNPDFNGTDSFSYLASDGAAADTATVTIEVGPVPDFPVAQDETYETDEDKPLSVDAAAGVLANDSDADGDSLTAVRVIDVPHRGDLRLNHDGSFTYTPWPEFSGRDSFRYAASDGDHQSEATLFIEVRPVNDAPAAAGDTYQTDEDTTLDVSAAAGVLSNDSDVEGDALSAAVVSGPAHGSLELHPDGALSYTPERDYNGTDSFVYTANDGELDSGPTTVTINLGAVDDAPAAQSDSYHTNQEMPLTVEAPGVLANDSDADGDSLTAALVSGPAHGSLTLNADGSLSYTPNADYIGSDSFSYLASDGGLESDLVTVTIEVKPVDDAPPANPAQPPPANPAQPPADAGRAEPSADFTIGSVRFKNGSTVVSMVVPGPGTVAAQQVSAATARVGAAAKKKALVKRARKAATKAEPVRLTLKPTKAGMKVLRVKKKLTARIRFTFTPSGGTAKSTTKKIKIKLNKR
jgi:VCBS repeat-containing protein